MIEELRQSQRKPLKVKALLAMDGQPPVAGRTLDINANGVCVAQEQPCQVGRAGTIKFDIFYDGKPNSITAKVKVAYCIFSSGEFKLGLTFVNLDLNAMSVVAKYLK